MHDVVLCIDARERNLMSDRQLLETAGYQVLAATNLDAALGVVRKHDDISAFLVSDSLSTDLEGICATLHGLRPSARILVQRASFDTRQACEADVVIPKTTLPREKLRILGSLVAGRRAA
jgi:response regulator RpfG family c-di-GMP phosphodiesterase